MPSSVLYVHFGSALFAAMGTFAQAGRLNDRNDQERVKYWLRLPALVSLGTSLIIMGLMTSDSIGVRSTYILFLPVFLIASIACAAQTGLLWRRGIGPSRMALVTGLWTLAIVCLLLVGLWGMGN